VRLVRMSRFSYFREDEHHQNQQLWFDGMSIARTRIKKIVDRGISQHQPQKQPCTRNALANGSPQTPDRQHRRGEEERVSEVGWSPAIGRFGSVVPVVEESFQTDDNKAVRVFTNPLESHTLASLLVR